MSTFGSTTIPVEECLIPGCQKLPYQKDAQFCSRRHKTEGDQILALYQKKSNPKQHLECGRRGCKKKVFFEKVDKRSTKVSNFCSNACRDKPWSPPSSSVGGWMMCAFCHQNPAQGGSSYCSMMCQSTAGQACCKVCGKAVYIDKATGRPSDFCSKSCRDGISKNKPLQQLPPSYPPVSSNHQQQLPPPYPPVSSNHQQQLPPSYPNPNSNQHHQFQSSYPPANSNQQKQYSSSHPPLPPKCGGCDKPQFYDHRVGEFSGFCTKTCRDAAKLATSNNPPTQYLSSVPPSNSIQLQYAPSFSTTVPPKCHVCDRPQFFDQQTGSFSGFCSLTCRDRRATKKDDDGGVLVLMSVTSSSPRQHPKYFERDQPGAKVITISYQFAQRDLMWNISRALRVNGYSTFNREQIKPHESQDQVYNQYMQSSNICIVLLSAEYLQTEECRREILFMFTGRKTVIPIKAGPYGKQLQDAPNIKRYLGPPLPKKVGPNSARKFGDSFENDLEELLANL